MVLTSYPAGVEVTASRRAMVPEVPVLVDVEPVVPRRQTQQHSADPDYEWNIVEGCLHEFNVKIVNSKVKIVNFKVKIVNFKVKIVNFKVKIVNFRGEFVIFKVKFVSFKDKLQSLKRSSRF